MNNYFYDIIKGDVCIEFDESININIVKFIIKRYKEITKLSHTLRLITYDQRFEVLNRQKWKCNQCGIGLKYSKKSAKTWNKDYPTADIDHIHPWSKQESYHRGKENINETCNLQALCPNCNRNKKDKVIM